MIIGVDFDGVIIPADWWPKNLAPYQPPPLEYCRGSMLRIINAGHTITCITSRWGKDLTDAMKYAKQHNLPIDRWNRNPLWLIEKYGGESRKVYADVYLDDHNVGGFPGWIEAEKMINNL